MIQSKTLDELWTGKRIYVMSIVGYKEYYQVISVVFSSAYTINRGRGLDIFNKYKQTFSAHNDRWKQVPWHEAWWNWLGL